MIHTQEEYTHEVLISVDKGFVSDVLAKAKEFYSMNVPIYRAIKILNK